MQVNVTVTRNLADGSVAVFTGQADSVASAIAMAEHLATGAAPKVEAAPEVKAETKTPAASTKKEPTEKKSDAKTVSSPNTAAAETKSSAATAPEKSISETAKAALDSPEYVYEDVRRLVLQISKDKGREPTVAALARFGVTSGKDILPEAYGDAVKFFQGVIDGTIDPFVSNVPADDTEFA